MRFFVPALALLALAGCDAQSPKPPEPRATSAAKPAPAATPAPAETPALDPVARLAAAVRAVPKTEGRYSFKGDDRLIDAPFGPVLLRHGHVADAAHVDAGVVSVYYLRAEGAGFAVAKAYPEAAEIGSFGELEKWSVSRAFGDAPMLIAEGGGTWQGCTVAFAELVELRPGGPATVASIPTVYDDTGMATEGGDSLEGTIADIVQDRGFTVRYKGTESFAERYVRKGDRFALEGGESKVPGC